MENAGKQTSTPITKILTF